MRPWNPWLAELRFRKGLVLVCKAWSGPATAALYEDIVLRRMGQIPVLARTLSSQGGNDFGPLIQHLRIDSCVVWAPCADVVREDLMLILQRCTALRSFSFHPHPKFPSMDVPDESSGWDGFNPTWVVQDHTDGIGRALQDRLWSGLCELDINLTFNTSQIEGLHRLLSPARSLRTLKLGPRSPGSTQDVTDYPELQLPALQELQLYIDKNSFYPLVCTRWTMPCLTHLTALDCTHVPTSLLEKHGAHLTYLHLCPRKKDLCFDHTWLPCPLLGELASLVLLCPVLDHLVVAASPAAGECAEDIVRALYSPTLRFVDVWCHTCCAMRERVERDRAEAVKSGRLPNLVRVRRLRRTLHAELPLVCHPSMVDGDEVRIVRFPCFYVAQTSWSVIPGSGVQTNADWFVYLSPEEDDLSRFGSSSEDDEDDEEAEGAQDEIGEKKNEEGSDGSPYEPHTSVSQSGSEGDSSEEDEDEDAEISGAELDVVAWKKQNLSEQFDRDTVLAMFEKTRQHDDDWDTSDSVEDEEDEHGD